MVIKNKDGTPYTLRGPNPLMKEQDLWAEFQLHNMEFSEQVITNNNKEIVKNKSKLNLGKTVVETDSNPIKVEKVQKLPEIDIPIKQEETQTPPVPVNEEPVERPVSINSKLLNYKRTVINCLPAIADVHIDDLYGERSVKIKYDKKFNFEAILIEEDDFNLVFWTHLSKVTKYSVLYPKNKDKRWWKVTAIKQAPEGFFISCMPSEYHPNFD
jgi:hypothetical protein